MNRPRLRCLLTAHAFPPLPSYTGRPGGLERFECRRCGLNWVVAVAETMTRRGRRATSYTSAPIEAEAGAIYRAERP